MLRQNVDHDWKPPGGGHEGALAHDVIHGWTSRRSRPRLRGAVGPHAIVLGGLTSRQVKFFGADLAGVELRADDLDWHFGDGDPLQGSAQDLLLVICDRKLPAGHLRGPLSHRFTQSSR